LVLSIAVTIGVLTLLFAAIYKVLPDRKLAWRDVFIGAFTTAILFTAGKTLIAVYIGKSDVAAGFGAASAIIIVLVWLYYSALIFLAGAEFTRAWANLKGSKQAVPVPAKPADAVLDTEAERRGLQHRHAAVPERAPDAILQLLVALLPYIVTGLVQGMVERRSLAARKRRPLLRRG
jgi:membrane protein